MSDSDLSSLSSLSDMSSELSSVRSTPPLTDYPSPASSQEPGTIKLENIPRSKKRPLDDHGLPIAKKRKRPEPKPRTTDFLDLTVPQTRSATGSNPQLDLLLKVLRKRRKIVVIVGAGISVSAGIPDFRSSTGLFKSLKSEHKLKASGKQLFDASVYQTDSSTSSFHDMVRSLSHLVSEAKPTVFHQMLSTLAEEGRLMRLYTQNVDGIDVALPSLSTSVPLSLKGPWPRTIQLHGGLEKMVCSKCNHLSDFEAALFDGPEPPPCTVCIETDKVRTDHAGKRSHGIGRLRPRIVLYNEHNPDEEAIGAVVGSDLRARPDAVIVVGTSMKIPGVRRIVREMCGVVRGRRDGLAVWINRDPPPVGKDFEDCWDLVVKGACDDVARRWNGEEDYDQCTESDVERAKQRNGEVQVIIDSSQNAGIPTPAPSPHPKHTRPIKIKLKLKKPVGLKITSTHDKQPKNTKEKTTTKIPKPKPSKKPSKLDIPNTVGKINFKLTKPAPPPIKESPSKRKASEQDRGFHIPMALVSPSALRNNNPFVISSEPLFPNLMKPSVVVERTVISDRWKREGSVIVSPTGTIPKDMARMLN